MSNRRLLFQGMLSAGWIRVAMGAVLLVFLGLERGLPRRPSRRRSHREEVA